MICPKDVLQWFKTLESYKRIDTMCSLLEACLPFELRFLGTCLEELGRRDSPEFRSMELRANNPQDLATDMHNCQKGEPTDIKIRRKMALYLAMIRACNRSCVTEIFRTLECWGERDFASMSDQDTLLELLLVYTMAARHPVFSYHQHTKCGEILAKIKEVKRVTDETTQTESPPQQQQQQPPQLQQQQHPQLVLHQQQQQPGQSQPQPSYHPQMVQMLQTPQGTTPMIFSQHWPKLMPSNEVDGMSHLMPSNITIPADSNAIAAAAGAWSMRSMYAAPPPPQHGQQSSMDHQVPPPPQASSPMLSSQQSSPSSSRTTSPQRERVGSAPLQQQQQQQQQLRSLSQRITGGVKNVRRPSVETTPPPPSSSSSIGSGDPNMSAQHGKHMDESISESGGTSTGASLPSIIRNSFPRAVHQRINANAYMSPHQQQQQQQSPVSQQSQQQQQQHYQMNNYIKPSTIVYTMHNMHINDDGSGSMRSINSSKSAATTGSESGSSNGSCGEISPPETPTPLSMHCTVGSGMPLVPGYQQPQPQQQQQHQQQQKQHHLSYKQQQQMNLQQRLNGRNGVEKSYQQIYTTSNPSDAQSLQQQQQQQQQQQALLISPSAVSTPTTTVILQPQQQPQPTATAYNTATYPYHTASPRGPPQTLIQAHNAPPPQALHHPFRFPLAPPHNGELLYPAYHTGLAFSPVPVTAATAGAPTALAGGQMRNSAATVAVVSTNAVTVQTQTPTSQHQQQQQQLLAATVPTTPYTTMNVCPITGVSSGITQKVISCYNCGSQTHSGRDCQEASMEDVTRSATYKLDYSTSTNPSGGGIPDTSIEHKEAPGNILKSVTGTTPTPSSATVVSGIGK
ncbi:myb-like protein AA [Drosophila albomicans]|uniref:Myb-like protein AA n=1 Tax=Drosophila albomicans TaxID=7291 RepID=A0A6P8WQN5_DROAB|nr:myb-like protein AA [Drosophila albomicans]